MTTPPDSPGPRVNPEYAKGELVTVATAFNQAEAEFIQNLLLEEGVPSLVQRTGGADIPDFLAAGPRVVRVPASGEAAARDILMQPDQPEG
ncbi:MAG: DUF2007 domain-containing protein [Thermoleophilaceae bacterium]|nr:DUF2007 domain-containing protein [Thermoleophilaceae bacterium]